MGLDLGITTLCFILKILFSFNQPSRLFLLGFFVVSIAYAQDLPSAKIQTLVGKSIVTTSWIDNETPFVLSFWSTTCKPCLKELDTLSENYEDWNERNERLHRCSGNARSC